MRLRKNEITVAQHVAYLKTQFLLGILKIDARFIPLLEKKGVHNSFITNKLYSCNRFDYKSLEKFENAKDDSQYFLIVLTNRIATGWKNIFLFCTACTIRRKCVGSLYRCTWLRQYCGKSIYLAIARNLYRGPMNYFARSVRFMIIRTLLACSRPISISGNRAVMSPLIPTASNFFLSASVRICGP
jgi:hypothetical protein